MLWKWLFSLCVWPTAGNHDAQGLVEYALILFLVAIVVVAVLILLSSQIGSVISSVYGAMGGS
jgi:pilus assembly protein Flp/PilA